MHLNFLSRIPSAAADAIPFIVPARDDGSVNLRVDGADAQEFLQGQLTIDLSSLQPGHTQIGALCTPQGRVSAVFDVMRMPDCFILILPLEIAPAVATQLQRYVMRSRVSIGPAPAHGTISAYFDPHSDLARGQCTGTSDAFIYNPGWLAQGWCFTNAGDGSAPPAGHPAASWPQARILWGVTQPVAKTQNLFLPQMLNLEKHGGVSFNKGCYTGQEVIARTHFRGTVKRCLQRYVRSAAAHETDAMQLADAIVTADHSTAGTIVECAVDGAGNQAILAVVKTTAADALLFYGEQPLLAWPLD